ncbi:MAG: GTPase [Planctomycetota bacterium]|nr:GTPase [Planctomycetota bacterium]
MKASGGVRFTLGTPPPVDGGAAIAVFHLAAQDGGALDAALGAIGAGRVGVGAVVLRDLAGVDRGLVARVSERAALLTPHGGAAIIAALSDELEKAGIVRAGGPEPGELFPEAQDEIEACALDALWRSASPRAAAIVLEHARRWRAGEGREVDERTAAALGRLLSPPLVALIGPANAGKSTLTNLLARRNVSIVSDTPGTTRDHVGVMLVLDGVAVRWIDTPGVRRDVPAEEAELERAAQAAALEAARGADLLVLAVDPVVGETDPADVGLAGIPVVRLAMRGDLGAPARGCAVGTAAGAGRGSEEVARAVRGALVPEEALRVAGRWRFHAGLPGPAAV